MTKKTVAIAKLMTQIIIGSIILSLIHSMIPNHWIPLVAIGKTENWSRLETIWATAITGSAHTISTILVGVVVGLVGYKLSSTHEIITKVAAPIFFITLGIIYIILDYKSVHHHHDHLKISSTSKKSKFAIITSLSITMFFSPCIEIEAYFFSAGTQGWMGIIIVSIIYLITTVLGMILLVDLGRKGIENIKWHYLEHHEKKIVGITLIVLGIFAYFVEI